MQVNTLNLDTNEKVYILDQVFDPQSLAQLHAFCRSAQLGTAPWELAEHFGGKPRFLHNESSTEWSEFIAYFSSTEFVSAVENIVGCTLKFSTASIWADQTGFGALRPHKEQGGSYMMQVYLTDVPHDWTGTTIYNEHRQILVQLPYRDNFGWLFHGQKVMHGRHHDVPKGLTRFTLQIWFDEDHR